MSRPDALEAAARAGARAARARARLEGVEAELDRAILAALAAGAGVREIQRAASVNHKRVMRVRDAELEWWAARQMELTPSA